MSRDSQLPYAAPEAQGIGSSAILAFVEAAERNIESLHSFMLLRHGQVLAEGWWSTYEAERPHMLFSLSKSFASTAIGLAVAEGRLSIDDRVLSFFPEEAPAKPSEHLAAMCVHDLLSMSTGYATDHQRCRQYAECAGYRLGAPAAGHASRAAAGRSCGASSAGAQARGPGTAPAAWPGNIAHGGGGVGADICLRGQ